MDYIKNIPSEDAGIELARQFTDIYTDIVNAVPNNTATLNGWTLETPKREFITLMHVLERFFFLDEFSCAEDYTNKMLGKPFYTVLRNVQRPTAKTGFIITIAPKTQYQEIEGIRHLEVFEKELKEFPAQFIKIFTANNMLFVYMNRQPTWNQLLKLKILQWTLFKNHIRTPEPSVMDFLNGMLESDLTKINNAINKIVTRPDLIEYKYKELMSVFEYGANSNLRNTETIIRDLYERVSDYENRLNETISEIHKYNTMLASFENEQKEDLKPLIKYLVKHPYITKAKPMDNHIVLLHYEAPIVYFDKYTLEKIMKRKTGTDLKILEIFDKNEYELITRCEIKFDTTNFRVRLMTIGDGIIIGHPHIDRFNCFGNHNKAIQDAAEERNYFGAIEQISEAVLNLNFTDTYVIDSMLNTLRNNLAYCITWRHKLTGTMLSTMEVIDQYEKA